MKNSILSTLFFLLLLSGCTQQQKSDPKTLYNEDFKWTITIPENFVTVTPQDSAKMVNIGQDAIEETYGEEMINEVKTIFGFKNGNFNYMESNYQPFDVEVDGDYVASCKEVNTLLYEVFKSQMPNATLDSSSSVENISNLNFQTFKMKMVFPNGMTMHSLMYSRLFDKKEFTVNIMYVDEKLGKNMIEAWIKSKFE